MKTKNNYSQAGVSQIISVYVRATGTHVQMLDQNFQVFDTNNDFDIEQNICRCCNNNSYCQEMYVEAIQESSRRGKPHIYQCKLGLMFWVSPIYRNGKFSGALRGSGYVSGNIDKSVLENECNGMISPDEFTRRVLAFPSGDAEKIKSLAEMLLLCAEFLSTGGVNYHEILRLRSDQQTSISVLVEELKKKYPQGAVLPGYPLDKERQLIASLRQGDKKETEELLNKVMATLIFSNPNQFRYIQLRAMELAVLLFRSGIHSNSSIIVENNARQLKQIQEAKTIEELTSILHGIVENIAGQITSFQGIPHALSIRKAEIFIRENLTRKINLREIAKVAGLSAPYFSTIFKEEMGENLSRYINRLRVEKASKMLLETNIPLSEISNACCFEDQSWFSKIFKTFTGVSPGKYRSQGGSMVQTISEHNFNV